MRQFESEAEINQHYDAQIRALQAEVDATVQQMNELDNAHSTNMAMIDAALAASRERSRIATEKRQQLEAAFYAKYGYWP